MTTTEAERLADTLERGEVGVSRERLVAALRKQEADIENLHTVMMAAAVEITEHWDAHCDDEGYGPANLVRRLENCYPSQYGYDAQTVVRMEKRCDEQAAEIERLTTCLKKANDQGEHFEREWYLRGDAIERKAAEIERLTAELGDLPEAQALLLSDCKRKDAEIERLKADAELFARHVGLNMERKDALLRESLDALENSVDEVWHEYTEAVDLYGKYQTRKAKLEGMKAMADAHSAAIANIKTELGDV